MSGAAIPDVNQPFTECEGWGQVKCDHSDSLAIPTALNWCQLPVTGYIPEVLWLAPEKTSKPSHQLQIRIRVRPLGLESRNSPAPQSGPVSLLAGVGCHFRGQCVWGRNEWIIWVTSCKEKYTFSFSQSLTFGEWCCHTVRIKDRSGNEPKLLNLVLLYCANVFLSNIPKDANDHPQHKFSGSCKYLPKRDQAFLTKYLHTLVAPDSSFHFSQLPRPPPLCSLLPREAPSPGRGGNSLVQCPVPAQGIQVPPPINLTCHVKEHWAERWASNETKPPKHEELELTNSESTKSISSSFWMPQTCTWLSSQVSI